MKNKSRFLIECAYLGTNYSGWQRQPNGISVQEEIEKAFSTIFQAAVQIQGSSRTDAGVHAKKQYAHVDLPENMFKPENLIFNLNNMLPLDIAINSLIPVSGDFHSRFEATGRKYIYRIHRAKDPFSVQNSYYFRNELDLNLMNQGANLLITHNDFQCFSKVKTAVNNFNCDISLAEWRDEGHQLLFSISSNRFLRGMVRAIVGTLLDVGMHKTSIEEFTMILKSNNRSKAGRNVPAVGLTLENVFYHAK